MKKNLGCGGLTRNTGLNYLFNDMKDEVEYVAFLDSDDTFNNEKYFEIAYNKLKKTDSDLIISYENVMNSIGVYIPHEFKEETFAGNCLRLFGENEEAIPALSNKFAIVRKELIKNLRFNDRFAEDSFYLLYELSLAKRATTIPGAYYDYYFHSENSMFFKYSQDEVSNGLLTSMEEILQFWKERGEIDSLEKSIMIISIFLTLLTLLLVSDRIKIPPLEKLNELFDRDLASKEIYENPKLFKTAKKVIDMAKSIK